MKNLFLILLIVLIGCSSDDSKPELQENTLIGSWRLIELYATDGDGSELSWSPAVISWIYNFQTNGSITRDSYECAGTFQYNSNNLTINFECSDVQFNETFDVIFENQNLILTPNSTSCDEAGACAYKFEKIASN